MSGVLFGHSYFLRFDPKLWQAMQPYPPLGTLFAAAYLRQRGFEVALFDAMLAASEEEFASALDRHQPDYAVLYEDNFNYLSKMCLLRMREAAWRMIDLARQRGATVIVCGADATDHSAEYLERGAHFVLNGEGEATLAELLERLQAGGERFDDILGLTAAAEFAGTDEPLRTPPRPVLRDLDALPFPAWDLVDMEHYRRLWRQRHGYFSINMVTTRGCPFHCNWCAKPIWGQTYHQRSPALVAAELSELQQRYQPDHIWFCDDILGLKKGWLEDFAAEVERRGVRTPFKCLSRADLLLRPGEIEALAKAGCRVVWIGAESGSQRVLDAMDKGTKVEQIHRAAELLHQAGVKVGFFLQFGYPGESREEIELTRTLVRDCQPDEIGMSVSYPLPGTKFYDLVKQELGEKRNWVDSNDFDMMYRGPFTTAFYRQLYKVVNKEFRAQLAANALRRLGHHPTDLRLGHLRRAAALLYHRLTLPGERRKLNRREKDQHQGLGPLSTGMSHEEASRPTSQASS